MNLVKNYKQTQQQLKKIDELAINVEIIHKEIMILDARIEALNCTKKINEVQANLLLSNAYGDGNFKKYVDEVTDKKIEQVFKELTLSQVKLKTAENELTKIRNNIAQNKKYAKLALNSQKED